MALNLTAAYDSLLGLSIDLNFNDAPNPAYIQTKLIECHEASRKVEKIHTELKMDMSRSMRSLSIEEGKFEVLQREALSQNETVKRFPSYQDRLAYVGTLLENNIETIRKLKSEAEEHKNLEKALNLIIKNLSRLNSDVKAQQKLMESQISKLGMGDVQDKDVKDLMSRLGTLSAEIDSDDLKVGEAEEDEATEEEKEEGVDLSALEDQAPLIKEEKVSSKVEEKPAVKAQEKVTKVDEDPLAGLLSSVSDKKKRDPKDTPPLKEEDTQIDVDLSASFLEDDIEDLDEGTGEEEEAEATVEEPTEYAPEPLKLKVETDDLEDALAGLSEEVEEKKKVEPKKELPKKEAPKAKAKKEEKPKVKEDEASEGEIDIDDLLLGIT